MRELKSSVLTEAICFDMISSVRKMNADVAQQVERRLGKAEVGGSSPLISFWKMQDVKGLASFLFSFGWYRKKEVDFMLEMKHCMQCGAKLTSRYLEGEGDVPYCESCQDFRFPVFNTAVSMIVMNESKSKIILIKQYNKNRYILVAGYVNKGEDAEDTCVREVKEELGLDVTSVHFNHSHYFAGSNTLMLNFTVTVDGEMPTPNKEIDYWKWFTKEEAAQNIAPGSLAEEFLLGYLTGEYHFH